MNLKIAITALMIVAIALTGTTFAALTLNVNIQSTGNVTTSSNPDNPQTGIITTSPNITIYSDSNCTEIISSVDWGSIKPGESTSKTAYVKNTGTGTVTLDFTVINWTPIEAGDYINIAWDATSTQLAEGQSKSTTLTLSVASTVTGITTFSNSIIISGTG